MKTIFGEKDRLLRQAQLNLSENHFHIAETLLLKYMSDSPDHFGQLYLALAIHQQNRTDEAIGMLQDIIKQKPKEPEVFHYHIALLYFDKNLYDKCISELGKIKTPNHFHEALKALATVFKGFTGNAKNYQEFYRSFKLTMSVSSDLQARVLLKLESYLPINLTKRAYPNSLPTSWRPLLFAKRRVLEKTLQLNELLKQSIKSVEAGEFKFAFETLETCFAMELNNPEVEKTRLRISELILANLEIALSQLGPSEIAWAYFYTQQFQKGIEFCNPYLIEKEAMASNVDYISLLDVSAYLRFCVGNFSEAEKLLQKKILLDSKDAEQATYYLAACLQHSKKNFEAINAYKSFIHNSLDGYGTQLNCAMKTIAPELIIN